MPTTQPRMWELMRNHLPKGEWVSLTDTYSLIEKGIDLQPDDFEPAAPPRPAPRWQRNVRNILQYRRSTGEIKWSRDARYMIPISADEAVITSSVPIKSGLSEKNFKKLQEKRFEIGQKGEEYIVEHERQNLIKDSREDLAKKVVRISEEDIGAGFDVLSFNIDGEKKYIEVKATTGTGSTFELTRNELRAAKKLGQQYWLYFVRDIDGTPQVTKIYDPAKQIDKLIKLEPSAYTVHLIENEGQNYA
jgi:hypothetical protein